MKSMKGKLSKARETVKTKGKALGQKIQEKAKTIGASIQEGMEPASVSQRKPQRITPTPNFRVYHAVQPSTGLPFLVIQKISHLNDPNEPLLVVDRKEGRVSSIGLHDFRNLKSVQRIRDVHLFAGVLRGSVLHSAYVLLITECFFVANIEGNDVHCVSEVVFHPLLDVDIVETGDNILLDPLQNLLESEGFYFSHELDLTLPMQERWNRRNSMPEPLRKFSFSEWTNKKFMWNDHILDDVLANKRLHNWAVPLIYGFVECCDVQLEDTSLKLIVVSRRSSLRAGTRFLSRGIDDDGNVSNFVETEQIMHVKDIWTSHIQIRGSVPVFWEQKGVQVGKARVKVLRSPDATAPAFDRHMSSLLSHYKMLLIVNLLGDKTAENEVSAAFQQQLVRLRPRSTLYFAFDFHRECKGGNYQRIAMLLDEIHDSLTAQSYFSRTGDRIDSQQNGVIRTNCLDCLDRTNVIQCRVVKRVLEQQLSVLKLLPASLQGFRDVVVSPSFESGLNTVWANNGDSLSMQYAGTGAMKSGLTRKGKRNFAGMMDDGFKSVTRLYKNHFKDQSKQSAIDFLLGKHVTSVTSFFERNAWFQSELQKRSAEYVTEQPITTLVCSWNVNGQRPPHDLSPWIRAGLPKNNAPPTFHVFAVGIQEVIALNPGAVVNTDLDRAKDWESAITSTLNRYGQYVHVMSQQLVGLFSCIFVRSDLVPAVRDVKWSNVKVGFGGMTGNKGGISLRMNIHETSMCFTNSHLAAGKENLEDRNEDYRDILEKTHFQLGGPTAQTGILDHDVCLWFGDFNYRIDLPNDETRKHFLHNEMRLLFAHDQLQLARMTDSVFEGFEEGPINFAPTYKFDPNSDELDTSEKGRPPAWTDRILFRGLQMQQLAYGSCLELKMSDHRAVGSSFQVLMAAVDQVKRDAILAELLEKYGDGDTQDEIDDSDSSDLLSDGSVRDSVQKVSPRAMTITPAGERQSAPPAKALPQAPFEGSFNPFRASAPPTAPQNNTFQQHQQQAFQPQPQQQILQPQSFHPTNQTQPLHNPFSVQPQQQQQQQQQHHNPFGAPLLPTRTSPTGQMSTLENSMATMAPPSANAYNPFAESQQQPASSFPPTQQTGVSIPPPPTSALPQPPVKPNFHNPATSPQSSHNPFGGQMSNTNSGNPFG